MQSGGNPTSDQGQARNRLFQPSSGSALVVVEPSHTRDRPPTLEESNFSAASMNEHAAGLQTMHTEFEGLHLHGVGVSDREGSINLSDSENADSTANTPDRLYPLYLLLRQVYGHDSNDAPQPLTEQAKRARDYECSTRQYPGQLNTWIETQRPPLMRQPTVNPSDSMRVGHPGTATTYVTSSSWDIAAPLVDNPTAEFVCGAGSQFEDSSTLHHLNGSTIPDALVRD